MNKKGVVLFIIIIWSLILTLTGAAFLYLSSAERMFSHKEIYPASAFWIAEAGVEHGRAWLEKQVKDTLSHPSETEPFAPFEKQQFGRGEYEVTIIPPNVDNPGTYRIVSVAGVETNSPAGKVTVEKEISLKVGIKSFARYAYFTNNEYNPLIGQTIWFTSHDISYGPVHSNSQINIYGNPVFHGKVTSTAGSFNYYNGGPPEDNPDFRAGYEMNAEEIDMNKYVNLQKLEDAGNSSGGIFIEGDSTVELNGNTLTYTEIYNTGRYDRTRTWTKTGNILTSTYVEHYRVGRRWRSRTVSDSRTLSPFFNGVIYATGDITVSGPSGAADARVYDNLTITAEEDMLITHRIRYNENPDNPACTGMLGLVAGNKIEVSSSAPSNMVIHASLMVFDESFSVQNYDSISPKGTLTVWGGIIQKYRGPVGTFYATTGQIASGYSKDYRYDNRVTDVPPPFFPTVEEGLSSYWDIGLWEQ